MKINISFLIGILVVVGVWGFFDGIGSILKYWHQTIPEHMIRIGRSIVGIAALWVAFRLYPLRGQVIEEVD